MKDMYLTSTSASRMCSHSLPGKILLSTKTHQKLSLSYEGRLFKMSLIMLEIFRTSDRGEVQVKGKGLVSH